MTTELYIKVDNKWSKVDLFNDIEIPLTMRVTDLPIGVRASGFSLDFDIPNTSNNCKIFGLAHELDIYKGSFEVGKNYDAYLTDGGLTTFEGQFRLKKVIKTPTSWHYVGYLYSGVKNFIDALGTSTLIGNDDTSLDLDFSEYDTPDEDMTLNDFVGRLQSHFTDGEDWGLTVIDKTNKNSVSFTSNAQPWTANELTPYLGAMGIFNRIIHSAGYDYDSKFLMGTDGNAYLQDPRWVDTIGQFDVYSMIYPYMRHNSNIQVLNKASSVVSQSNSNAQTDLVSGSSPSLEKMWFEVYNGTYGPRNWTLNFDTNNYIIQNNLVNPTLTAWKFVVPRSGIYNMKFNIPVYIRTQWYCDATGNLLSGRDTVTAVRPENTFSYEMTLMKNGRAIHTIYDNRTYRHETPGGTSDIFTLDNAGYTHLTEDLAFNYNDNVYLSNGDIIEVYCWVQLQQWENVWFPDQEEYRSRPSLGYTGHYIDVPWSHYPQLAPVRPVNLSFHVPSAADDVIISIAQQDGFYEGNPFYPNEILNPKTTKLDFFNTFVKMFNLYVEDVSGKPKPDGSGIYPNKCLRIEPYECYYDVNQANTLDWTDKIDWDNVEYNRVEEYLYNTQRFTIEQNNDFFNEDYNSTWIMDYGCRDVKGPYCTTNEENKIELKNGGFCCGLVSQYTDTIQCPKAFTINKQGNVDTKKEYSDALFFLWRNKTQLKTQTGNNYLIKLQSNLSAASININDYYCADVANNGYGEDTATLLWASPQNRELKNDLYNAFYKKQIDDYTSPDAMVMKAQIYLSSFDITKLKLSDRIIIDGRAWRILELNQWKNEKTPCEIILIKVLN